MLSTKKMSRKNLSTVPVYGKAMQLCHLSREIASYISFNKDLLHLYKSKSFRDVLANAILTDAILIPQQIASAERSTSRSERIKRASFIGVMINNINSYCTGLEKDGIKEKEYLDLLRKETKLFRSSFRKWRKSLASDSF